jgi:hypothetical protein
MPRLNVQADIRDRLAKALPGFHVAVSVPEKRKYPLIVVRRSGGGRDKYLDFPTLTILVWDTSEQKAFAAAEKVSDLMHQLPFLAGYGSINETSFYSDFDTDAGCPRWHLSYNLSTFKE